MKVCILGDTHFGARNDNIAFHRYFEKFYENTVFPYLKEHNIDTIIQMGDIFDRRRFINFNTLEQSRRYFFDKLEEHDIKLKMILGNHDTYYKNTNEINSPELLLGEYSDRVEIWSEPGYYDHNGFKFAMIPWICSGNYDQSMEFIAEAHTQAKVAIGHLELSGFEMYKGVVHEGGLTGKVFEKFPLVLSGHFHHISKQNNIQYVGSPYELTWSDWNDPRGFFVLETDTLELTFVENPYKMFRKWWYDDDKIQSYEDLDKINYDDATDAFVKIVVRTKNNPFWFDTYIQNFEKAGALDISIVDDNLNLQLEDDSDIIDEAQDTLTILKQYASQVNSNSVNPQQLDSLLTELYQEAMTIE